MKVHTLKTCDSCRKATNWLRENNITFEEIPIRENPPSASDLRKALAASGGGIRKLFNTSGQDYRNLGMKEKLPKLSEVHSISLLASNGNLVRRPFLISGETILVGFKPEEWAAALRS